MAIAQNQVAIVIKELMTSVTAAREAGFPIERPGSVTFNFPIDASGATVQFEVRLDWYAGADERRLWPTAAIAP